MIAGGGEPQTASEDAQTVREAKVLVARLEKAVEDYIDALLSERSAPPIAAAERARKAARKDIIERLAAAETERDAFKEALDQIANSGLAGGKHLRLAARAALGGERE